MTTATGKQTRGFKAEVKQLLKLMINSLYSNKEIFLRELISNASDAADKLRFTALSNSEIYAGDSDLRIKITVDKERNTLTVSDNGIGMTLTEAEDHLGTIAKSGTKEFLEHLSGDQAKDAQMIGQFGVGFYSAFIVADKVTVISRSAAANADEAVSWESQGDGEYTVQMVSKPSRGTDVILHLKEDEKEFLEEWRLRSIIKKYSDHIATPVVMLKEKESDEKEGEAVKTCEEETVNQAKALWTRNKNDISDEDYKQFYKHVSHDFDDPLVWSHNRVEGKSEYTSLLYIPKHAPFDLWNRDVPHGLKLYVQRVFIMDDAKQFLPLYLRFIKGIVDTNDLPLNVSREILQGDKRVENMRNALTKRALGMLSKLAAEDNEKYQTVWKTFGTVIKEGVVEDFANQKEVAALLRFASTHNNSETQTTSFEDYIGRMKNNQDKIYYITADTYNAAKSSPHLEIFNQKGIEVLLLTDKIDEWVAAHLTEFNGKKLQSVAKGSLDLEDQKDEETKKAEEAQEKTYESMLAQIKKVLDNRIKEARLTHRLTTSPACIVADEHDLGGQMERILKAAGQAVPETKPVFEINPDHALILRLRDEQDDSRFADWAHILLDQAILAEGGALANPADFVKRLNGLLLALAK
ncbi:MAG: htpG [Gammaproteobacteria bacterium]|nr:htpG [Gammaproteobacteria bacterium]